MLKFKKMRLWSILVILFLIQILLVVIYNQNQRNDSVKKIIKNQYFLEREKAIHGDSRPSNTNKTALREKILNTQAMRNFVGLHNEIIEQQRNGRPNRLSLNQPPPKGYGNRLYSMLSSMTIALFTDSALLMKSWDDLAKYIEEPFPYTFTYPAQKDPMSVFNSDFRREELIKPECAKCWKMRKLSVKKLIRTDVPKSSPNSGRVRYFYNDLKAYFFQLCANPKYYAKIRSFGLASESTLKKALEMSQLPEYTTNEEILDAVLRVGFEVGGNLLNTVWRPKAQMRQMIENEYVNGAFKNAYVIGLQFRFAYLDADWDTFKFIECAEKIERSLPSFIKERYPNGVKWFVTSDQSQIIEKLDRLYPNRVVSGVGKLGHVYLDGFGYERAVLDLELLGYCQDLVVTGGSTFGFVGAMKADRMPFAVNGKRKSKMCELTSLVHPSVRPEGPAVF